MRVLALDLGERRIGMAISDELGWGAHPLYTLERTTLRADLDKLAQIAEREGAAQVVVGLPLGPQGEVGTSAKKVERFVSRLRARLKIPVITWDETLTSVEAEQQMIADDVSRAKRRRRLDQAAAALILQSYLERECKERRE